MFITLLDKLLSDLQEKIITLIVLSITHYFQHPYWISRLSIILSVLFSGERNIILFPFCNDNLTLKTVLRFTWSIRYFLNDHFETLIRITVWFAIPIKQYYTRIVQNRLLMDVWKEKLNQMFCDAVQYFNSIWII